MDEELSSIVVRNTQDAQSIAERAFAMRYPDQADFFTMVWNILARTKNARSDAERPDITGALAMGAGPDHITVAMAQEIKVYFLAMMKFPLVRSQLIDACRTVCKQQGLAEEYAELTSKHLQAAIDADCRFLVVSAGRKGKPHEEADLSENGAREKYLRKRSIYDIFVLENRVWVRSSLIDGASHRHLIFRKGSTSIRYRMFIIMLRYRGIPLPSRWLFSVTRDITRTDEEHLRNSDFTDQLRFEIRDIKKRLNAKYLSTPAKEEGEDYVCEGNFSFCLIIPMSLAAQLTMPT